MPGMREPNKVSGAAFSGKFNLNLPQTTLHEVAVDPSWRELFACMFASRSISGPPTIQSCNSLICFLLLVLGRMTSLHSLHSVLAYGPYLITYIILRFLASSGGLAAIHDAIWIPLHANTAIAA
ncbi:hypothetical protein EDB19DRAFT_1974698 [Suillus lakei]|nr:hypothetical protein EDB19DRAFT_1974698 [Suillus lakei]